MNVAVVVPTIRESGVYKEFLDAWGPLFSKHKVFLYTVIDGPEHRLRIWEYPHIGACIETEITDGFLGDYKGYDPRIGRLIPHMSPACRNLGFAYLARYGNGVDYIITLDDDVRPDGDTIQDHIDALGKKVSLHYFNTFVGTSHYPRGFPYNEREKYPVMLSHGVWNGVKDWDAPTQLVLGNPDVEFYKGPIPSGVEFSYCGMNIAFRREALPYIYYAPVANYAGSERFDDIWWGRFMKRKFDQMGWATVTGYAAVKHERASNVYKNLQRESVGIEVNEDFWFHQRDMFFVDYKEKRELWEAWTKQYVP